MTYFLSVSSSIVPKVAYTFNAHLMCFVRMALATTVHATIAAKAAPT